uniref:Holliday junction resolvase n=1 Tax=Ammonifex degensii TaxID=42838 RepID=A0A7C1F7T2_9THEO
MPGGKAPKRKGDAAEREICKLLGGERTYWQPGREKKPDTIDVPYLGHGEVKRRKRFDMLYAWLEGVDFVALRADRKPWLVILRAEDVKQLIDEMDELKRIVRAIGPN